MNMRRCRECQSVNLTLLFPVERDPIYRGPEVRCRYKPDGFIQVAATTAARRRPSQ